MFDQVFSYFQHLRSDKSDNTVRSYSIAFDTADRFFNWKSIEDFFKTKKSDIVSYRQELLNSNTPSTVNARIRPLKAMASWFIDMGMTEFEKNPFSGIHDLKEPKKLPVYLSKDESEKLLQACDNIHEKAMIAFLLSTGVRRGELVSIKWSDILDNQCVIINGKGNKQRMIPLLPSVYELLNQLPKNSDYVFSSMRGGEQIDEQAVYFRLKKICRNAGIDEERISQITPHKLRHTVATRLIENGVGLSVIQEILGHQSYETTLRYAHITGQVVKKAIDTLGE